MPGALHLTQKVGGAQTAPGVPVVIPSPLPDTVANPVAGGGLAPFVLPSEHYHPMLSYAEANVRIPTEVYPQAAPDPERQSEIPTREARQQIAVMSNPEAGVWGAWSSDHFEVPKIAQPPNVAEFPRGEMAAAGLRPNVVRPAAVAYGSLFALSPHDEYGFR